MKKVMVVFGTRPEAIKMAPLCHRLREQKDIETIICVTAQHREMLDQVLSIFELTPDIDLNVMKKGQDLYDVTSNILLKMRDTLKEEKPDIVIVHGDTTTTFATSLACFYMGVKVGHVEAGLRTHDIHAPFPEEYNRLSTGIIADYHFAPTDLSQKNLLAEGKNKESIIVTGNTVIDALHLVLKTVDADKNKSKDITLRLNERLSFDWKATRFVLITGHRRENFGQGFLDICEAIKELAIKNPDTHFVYPLHLNPNVQKPVNEILLGIDNVWLIEPLEYEDFVYLLKQSYLVLTDSGGIQEEAPSLGKPVLVMRELTERPEAVEAGTVKLVGASRENIIFNIDLLLNDEALYKTMSRAHNPYGDGKACDRIVEYIKGS
ncbi:MAG: UDP-N-acetylglucosamine 2-epimerase (non-hydrolyzing) [Porticoccaceae bacterium]|nr:UDP-N-acetylglucosamine 2-epimerase (non-hydrolyzing) [Porticoccaceae bacterium]